MNKLSMSNLVKFRRKSSDKTKQTLVRNIFKPKEDSDSEQRSYWVTSGSAIGNAFKFRDTSYLDQKIAELLTKVDEAELNTTIIQYKSNISILESMLDYDFDLLYPPSPISMMRKPRTRGLVSVEGINLQALPQHVFSWSQGNVDYVGAVWFVAVKDGYSQQELGIFADMLYRYLKQEFGENYTIDTEFCLVIDTVKAQELAYARLESGEISKVLLPSLRNLKRFIPVSI